MWVFQRLIGYIINKDGVRADPAKIQAILDLPPPSNTPQMRQFVGMINQVAKFVSCALVIRPLTELLYLVEKEAFAAIKKMLTEPTVLALYDPSAASKILADAYASLYGIGAILLQ